MTRIEQINQAICNNVPVITVSEFGGEQRGKTYQKAITLSYGNNEELEVEAVIIYTRPMYSTYTYVMDDIKFYNDIDDVCEEVMADIFRWADQLNFCYDDKVFAIAEGVAA